MALGPRACRPAMRAMRTPPASCMRWRSRPAFRLDSQCWCAGACRAMSAAIPPVPMRARDERRVPDPKSRPAYTILAQLLPHDQSSHRLVPVCSQAIARSRRSTRSPATCSPRARKTLFFFEPVFPCQVALGESWPQRAPRVCSPARAAHRHGRADFARWPRRRARATPAHPASDCGVCMNAPLEADLLAKPCCSHVCIRLLAAELHHQEILRSRNAIEIAIADGPNPTAQAARLLST